MRAAATGVEVLIGIFKFLLVFFFCLLFNMSSFDFSAIIAEFVSITGTDADEALTILQVICLEELSYSSRKTNGI